MDRAECCAQREEHEHDQSSEEEGCRWSEGAHEAFHDLGDDINVGTRKTLPG